MDFLYRSAPPRYRGNVPMPTQQPRGLLSGLWCYLFGGGAAPAYRTRRDAPSAPRPGVSRCWWALTGSPQYKTPPRDAPSSQAPDVPVCEPADAGPDGVGDPATPEPIIAREILIYPG